MDISRDEQRVLHALAQGGNITPVKDHKGRITAVELYNRDGWRIPAFTLLLFKKLKSKKAIASQKSQPYRITRRGGIVLRPAHDERASARPEQQ